MLWVGTDTEPYVIASVIGDTSLALESAYQGDTAAAASYKIRHKVWMLDFFYSPLGTAIAEGTLSLEGGTFTNTEYNDAASGITLEPEYEVPMNVSQVSAAISPTSSPTGKMKRARSFDSGAGGTIQGIWVYHAYNSLEAGEDIPIRIETDSGGNPSGTLVHANAQGTVLSTTANWTYVYISFASEVTLAASTTYWAVATTDSDWESSGDTVNMAAENGGAGGKGWNGSSWVISWGLWHVLLEYPESGTNTWVSATYDLGAVPTADGSFTYTQKSDEILNSDTPAWGDEGDTLTYDTQYSDDGSAWSDGHTGQTAAELTIDDSATYGSAYHRYYRVKFHFTSATGKSSPILTAASFAFAAEQEASEFENFFVMIGTGPNVYNKLAVSPGSALLTALKPNGFGGGVTFQDKFFFSCGGYGRCWYYDGIAAAADIVVNLLQNDDSAGVNPPTVAERVVLYNERIHWYRKAWIGEQGAASTDCNATILQDSAIGWSADEHIGKTLRPNIDDYPERWFPITDSASDSVTCAGANLDDYNAGTDNYAIQLGPYTKHSWYSTSGEPADYPTVNFLKFGENDGDDLQALVPWRGALYAVCKESFWAIYGPDPTYPWRKDLLYEGVGTQAPYSVVAAPDGVYWWAPEGIVKYNGGLPTPITDDLRDLLVDGVNMAAIHHAQSHFHNNLLYFSYPATGSNVNNRTLVYNPFTGNALVMTWGCNSFATYIGANGNAELYFQEPLSGRICKWATDTYTAAGEAMTQTWELPHVNIGEPYTDKKWLYLKVVMDVPTGVSTTVTVETAQDYNDTWTSRGTLQPWNTHVTGRTTVNAADSVYLIRFEGGDNEINSPSLAVRLSGQLGGAVKIIHAEVTADPTDVEMHR